MSQELLPCPFCNGEAELRGITQTEIRCTNDQCISSGAFNDYGHRDMAIAAWNTRSPASTIAEVDGNASLNSIDWPAIRAAVAKAAWPTAGLVDEAMKSIRAALAASSTSGTVLRSDRDMAAGPFVAGPVWHDSLEGDVEVWAAEIKVRSGYTAAIVYDNSRSEVEHRQGMIIAALTANTADKTDGRVSRGASLAMTPEYANARNTKAQRTHDYLVDNYRVKPFAVPVVASIDSAASSTSGLSDGGRAVLEQFDAGQCRVGWMRDRLPANAKRVDACPLPRNQQVLVWLSDPAVSIWFHPAVARWDGHTLWSGLPGSWTRPSEQRWAVTHWLELPELAALAQPDAVTSGMPVEDGRAAVVAENDFSFSDMVEHFQENGGLAKLGPTYRGIPDRGEG